MQPVPEGYEALDFVGFTDRGIWSSTETYIKNDIVHKDNIAWLCLVDDTTGITPAEGTNWTLFMDSTSPFYGAYDTFPAVGEPGRFYIDDTVDPRLMYTWDTETQKYILTGGAGGADGGSVDIPITLTSSGWAGTTAPYSQTITVPQMREKMKPFFFLDTQGDPAEYAFSLLTGYNTGYAEITFYAAEKPAVDLDLILKGIPAQELEYVDNTVVFLVEPSAFTQNATTQRYEATITVPGMTEGTGGVWDIVRSGTDLTVAESKIALSITDVDRQDGAVKITCLEVPAQRYMMSISGAYPDAEPGTVILAGMQEWFDRVDEQQDEIEQIKNKHIWKLFISKSSSSEINVSDIDFAEILVYTSNAQSETAPNSMAIFLNGFSSRVRSGYYSDETNYGFGDVTYDDAEKKLLISYYSLKNKVTSYTTIFYR